MRIALFMTSILDPMMFSCAAVVSESDAVRASAHFKIGVGYLNENKAQQAFVEFQRAYDLNPNDKEVLNAIGIVYLLYYDASTDVVDLSQSFH